MGWKDSPHVVAFPQAGQPQDTAAEQNVLNQITFDRKPEDLILDPFSSQSLRALRQPDFLWRPIERTNIQGFAASAHTEINEKIENYLSYCARNKVFQKAIEFNTIPVLLENAWFKKSFVSVDDKCLISGAAGIRLLNRYCWENGKNDPNVEQGLIDYFLHCQDQAEGRQLAVAGRAYPERYALCGRVSQHLQLFPLCDRVAVPALPRRRGGSGRADLPALSQPRQKNPALHPQFHRGAVPRTGRPRGVSAGAGSARKGRHAL